MTALSSAHDRRLLAESVRRCVREHGGPRPYLGTEPGVDHELWGELVSQVGVAGLLVPERCRGAGAGMREIVAVLTELAAQLAPVPALASAGMASALLRALPSSEPVDALLERLADGAEVATVAWPDPGAPTLTPTLEWPGGDRLRGTVAFAPDGMRADLLLTFVRDGDEAAVVAVELAGARRTAMASLDLTRGFARLDLDTPAAVLARAESAEAFGPALDLALVAVAAEQIGLAQHCLAAAVAYAKDRVQFGRSIGSFQAVKHLLVTLLMDLELARSALDVAAEAADAYLAAPDPGSAHDLRVAASMAKAVGGDASVRVAGETLHIFGGIGFTWEHEAHLYVRRAKSLELYLGSPAAHRRRLAAALGIGR